MNNEQGCKVGRPVSLCVADYFECHFT